MKLGKFVLFNTHKMAFPPKPYERFRVSNAIFTPRLRIGRFLLASIDSRYF